MALFIGIIGLPNVGKSTLFNALTGSDAAASNYPFATVDPNVGVVAVPDARLDVLNRLLEPTSCTPTAIRFVDIAGLVRGASHGEGLGNTFLGQIAEADALLHVVRCFADQQVVHVEGRFDPMKDIEILEVELALADLARIEQALPRLQKIVQTDPGASQQAELEALRKAEASLSEGILLNRADLSAAEQELLVPYQFLTTKPMLYVCNVSEMDAAGGGGLVQELSSRFGEERVLAISAQIEAEISQLDAADRREFMTDLGLSETGVSSLIGTGYRLLGLITFYTTAHEKLQAWQLPFGSDAQNAAGRIHTDMGEGFIRAEVVGFADLEQAGGMTELRNLGRVRTEGRHYVVQDGDVIHFLFRSG